MTLLAKEVRFEWLPTECAPIHFPVRLLQGSMRLADGSTVRIPDRRNIANGWGQRGSTHITDPHFKALPVSMHLRWFSWREDAFFEGRFDLPRSLINAYFQQPLTRGRMHERPEPFTRVIVGMGPEGFVSTWLDAGGEVVEIATFTAESVQLPWSEVTSNTQMSRKQLIAEVINEKLSFHGLSVGQIPPARAGAFHDYHRRYNWKPSIHGTGTPRFLDTLSFNGENSRLWITGPAVQRETHPVPSVLEIGLTSPRAEILLTRIALDEEEVLKAFAAIAKEQPHVQMTLHLELSRGKAQVSLAGAGRSIAMARTETSHRPG